jgi:type II secretory pathway pseudopilin PulG
MKHITLPKVPFIKSKHLLIILGIAVVVAVILAGAAEATRSAREQTAKDNQIKSQRDKQDQANQAKIKELTVSLKSEQSKTANLCQYINGLATSKATKPYVKVPPQYCPSI